MKYANRLSVCTLLVLTGTLMLTGCERPPVESEQVGYRGTAMVQVNNPRLAAAQAQVPDALPAAPASGPRAGDVYENVQVLGDLSVPQFNRLMASITQWVSPEQGCTYCHAGASLADDSVYTKRVSRRMLEMTRHINANWQDHVTDTGVTCYTCHRGEPVPAAIWFQDPEAEVLTGMVGNRAGQNRPAETVGLSSLPADPFSAYLADRENIRVVPENALATGTPGASIQQTERTYGLMMHLSDALGVNCTYCHNSRSFASWEDSRGQRSTAFYGLRMVTDLNEDYLLPLQPEYPHERLGPAGDAPKVNCATCHQGAFKPLGGASMVADYPSLAPGRTQ